MKEVGVDELRRRLEAGEDLVVLDVREPDEVARGDPRLGQHPAG